MARFAGDLALAFMAHGGITLAGGLLPKIAPLLDPGEFRRIFESKYPMEKLLARIPVRLLMREDAQMHGLAAIAANPSRYAIDYASREWK
ncbi:MAG: glucokinase, partial [Beijerinckiaceae bacterium]